MSENYLPRILLCGNVNSFRQAANMNFELVGQISFTGAAERGEFLIFPAGVDMSEYSTEDFRVFLNGEEISVDTLRKILDGTADYIVFDNDGEFIARYNELYALGFTERFITRDNFFRQARHNFYSYQNFLKLADFIRENKLSSLLDLDGFFAETDFFLFDEPLPIVDAVATNLDKSDLILENFYGRIYDTIADCKFKIYGAILIGERTPEDFVNVLIETNDLAENILTFARKNSALEKWLVSSENIFEKISVANAENGNWYLLTKRGLKDFCVYVVTHKNAELDNLPEGYKIIHAGHAQAKETFGYLGDDTGENISELNLYLNEVTALYWIWKNTSHKIIGLNHYRRFFTESKDVTFSVEKILSRTSAEKILQDHDIILARILLGRMNISCWQSSVSGGDLENFVEKIFRKHLGLKQPSYLDAFDKVSKSFTAFQYEIFITRRNIFNAYCEWLFSFLLDVTDEIFNKTNIKQITNPRKYRIISFFAERLMTVWLMKNRLRIKKLPVLFREDV